MARGDNLKGKGQPKGGKSRNPSGRGKGAPNRSTVARFVLAMDCNIPEDIYTALKAVYPGVSKKMSINHVMTLVQAKEAILAGDTYAYKVLQDSAFGMPGQRLEHTGEDGEAIRTEMNHAISQETIKNFLEVFKNEY